MAARPARRSLSFETGSMLTLVLLVALLLVLVVMVVTRRHLGRLASLATLLAAMLGLIVMQDSGLLPSRPVPSAAIRP
jgi:preprotein translocase subunit SecD